MGVLLEIFRNIDNNHGKKEKEKNKEKFSEIIKFLNDNQKKVSDLSPEDYACEGGAAYVVANVIREKIKINQLRKIFIKVKKIEEELKSKKENEELDKEVLAKTIIILPEIAYAYGRGLMNKEFYELLKLLLNKDKLKTVKDFRTLTNFLTAIIAYYKATE